MKDRKVWCITEDSKMFFAPSGQPGVYFTKREAISEMQWACSPLKRSKVIPVFISQKSKSEVESEMIDELIEAMERNDLRVHGKGITTFREVIDWLKTQKDIISQ